MIKKYMPCNRCKVDKPLGEFRIMPSGKRNKFCKPCAAEYKEWLRQERENFNKSEAV